MIADVITERNLSSLIVCTKEDQVVSTFPIFDENLSPCSQEETDTRLLLHAKHVSHSGLKIVMIVANDTDVVVFAVP